MNKSYKFWYALLRLPLIFILKVLSLFNSKIQKRILFEQKNSQETGCLSFFKDHLIGDLVVHISSEGELEQVLPIINFYLDQEKKIELLFTSPSVEHKILDLYNSNSLLIRYLRIEIFNLDFYYLEKWVTAPKIILCRYDFFPEIISLLENRVSILCSGNLDYQDQRTLFMNSYYHWCYRQFDFIFWAGKIPDSFKDKPGMVKDFRSLRILNRLAAKDQALANANLGTFSDHIANNRKKNIIWGSFWKNELSAFNDFKEFNGISVTIAPHQLDQRNIDEIASYLTKRKISFSLISGQKDIKEADVYIVTIKGILCELYSLYPYAIVGGGHGVSVHSVLEPYLANCAVWCGPNVYRSTEYRYVKTRAPYKISIAPEPKHYFKMILSYQNHSVEKIDEFDDNKLALNTAFNL